MRTFQPYLAGTVILMLLGAVGGAVVAQGDDTEELSLGLSTVAGTSDYGSQHPGQTVSNDEDRWRYRGGVFGRIFELDDPRLSGMMWSTWNMDTFPGPGGKVFGLGGALQTGSAVLVNDDGTWWGTARGIRDPVSQGWFIEFDLTGTGAYEGYSALLHVTGPAQLKDVNGFIFPGGWPAYPDPVEVPGE